MQILFYRGDRASLFTEIYDLSCCYILFFILILEDFYNHFISKQF